MQALQVNPSGAGVSGVSGVSAPQNTNNQSVVILQQGNACLSQAASSQQGIQDSPARTAQSAAPQTITVNGQVFALQPMNTADKAGMQGSKSTLQLVQPTTAEEPTTNVADYSVRRAQCSHPLTLQDYSVRRAQCSRPLTLQDYSVRRAQCSRPLTLQDYSVRRAQCSRPLTLQDYSVRRAQCSRPLTLQDYSVRRAQCSRPLSHTVCSEMFRNDVEPESCER
ncbi:unnamed protein product [Arctogadus glacialis]